MLKIIILKVNINLNSNSFNIEWKNPFIKHIFLLKKANFCFVESIAKVSLMRLKCENRLIISKIKITLHGRQLILFRINKNITNI